MSYIKHQFSDEILQQVQPYKRSNNWSWVLAIGKDYTLILAAAYATYLSIYVLPLSLLIIGSRQRALAALLHHATHNSLAKNKKLNFFLADWLVAYPIFQNAQYYKKVHILHHAHLGSLDEDTDRIAQVESGLASVTDKDTFYKKFFLKQVLMFGVLDYLKYLLTTRLIDMLKDKKDRTGILVCHSILFVAFYFVYGVWGYLLLWILPYITVSQLLGWFLELSEHYRLYEKETQELKMARNRFPAWWERMFFGHHGEVYHLTHHLFPSVPSWNLSKVHNILMQDDEYRSVNQYRGGLLSAPKNRKSILTEIMESY